MVFSSVRLRALAVATVALACTSLPALAQAKRKPARSKTFVVCKHGCRYSTIQSAVNASGRGATIKVKPGRYVEGVIVKGHRHDGLHIIGTGKTAASVVIEGRNARGPEGAAQNGVEGDGVNNLDLENLKAEHFASNGFFINGCRGYLMKNLIGGFNHSYGLYVYRCIGGRMTKSVGYGNGDSAFYIGGTPFQRHPVWSSVDHDIAYKNVLGYSGTNSKYVVIRDSVFYNNGAGVVPNTLKSEPYEPASTGVIEHNRIFWNNFDYYRPGSPVRTVSGGVGAQRSNYPVGAGVILFGTTGWRVRDNAIFGNFLWGVGAFSDPTNPTKKALNQNNHIVHNTMGAAHHDLNGVDLFNDGSGRGTCFAGNGRVTMQSSPNETDADLYPTCPTTKGTGSVVGDGPQVFLLLKIASATTGQEAFWHVHKHPPLKGYKPYEGPPKKG